MLKFPAAQVVAQCIHALKCDTEYRIISYVRLSFIQLSAFAAAWKQLKLTDEDLRALESAIQADPAAPPVMAGACGLRKIRFAPGGWSRGKSGGARACYAYFPEFALVYLCAVFPKSDKANLTRAERNEYRNVLEAFDRYLRANWKKGWTP